VNSPWPGHGLIDLGARILTASASQLRTYVTANGKASPLFAAFANEVADGIHKMLVSDNTSVRLSEMEKALPHVTMEEDHTALRRIDFALAEHGETTAKRRGQLCRLRTLRPSIARPLGLQIAHLGSCSIIGVGGGGVITSTCDPSRF
jgi:hypothetical protein